MKKVNIIITSLFLAFTCFNSLFAIKGCFDRTENRKLYDVVQLRLEAETLDNVGSGSRQESSEEGGEAVEEAPAEEEEAPAEEEEAPAEEEEAPAEEEQAGESETVASNTWSDGTNTVTTDFTIETDGDVVLEVGINGASDSFNFGQGTVNDFDGIISFVKDFMGADGMVSVGYDYAPGNEIAVLSISYDNQTTNTQVIYIADVDTESGEVHYEASSYDLNSGTQTDLTMAEAAATIQAAIDSMEGF